MYKNEIDGKVSGIEVTPTGCSQHSHKPDSCVNVDAKNLVDRESKKIKTKRKKDGAIARLPVTLAEFKVKFLVQSIIDLPEPALEIQDIRKNLKVAECTLLHPTNVLFVRGYIRKRIDYSTRACSNPEGVGGDLRHATVNVPFEFTTPIKYIDRPDKPLLDERRQIEYLGRECCQSGEVSSEADRLLSKDFSQYNQESIEYFNKQPFCDLIFSRIVEFDRYLNPRRPRNVNMPFNERTFTKLEEKMVVELGLRVLQEQQVVVPASHGYDHSHNQIESKSEIKEIEE